MTFNEADINRERDGRFGNKVGLDWDDTDAQRKAWEAKRGQKVEER